MMRSWRNSGMPSSGYRSGTPPRCSKTTPTRRQSANPRRGWAWPKQVIDLDEPLTGERASMLLDHQRCVPQIAYSLGVIREPVAKYDFEDEPLHNAYYTWVLETLNASLGPGERPIDRVTSLPQRQVSRTFLNAVHPARRRRIDCASRDLDPRLLAFGDADWDCEDPDSGVNYRVASPVRWAVGEAGIVNSTRGYRRPDEVTAPSLVQYRDLLPLFIGPGQIADILRLPDELEDVSVQILSEALATELLPATDQRRRVD